MGGGGGGGGMIGSGLNGTIGGGGGGGTIGMGRTGSGGGAGGLTSAGGFWAARSGSARFRTTIRTTKNTRNTPTIDAPITGPIHVGNPPLDRFRERTGK